jgi:eukaryotic-like serine/threonine-protein kinase
MAHQEELVSQLLEAARALKPAERSAFLDQVCSNDLELRSRLEGLLTGNGRPTQKPHTDLPGNATVTQSSGVTTPADMRYGLVLSEGRFHSGEILLERFRVVRFIGQGGMGEVYEVEDRFLQGVHVALKTILPQIAGDPATQSRFEREVLLARKVTHENLCPIYDIFRCEQPPPPFSFLTMKLLSGETLAARLDRHVRIPLDEAMSILRQMMAGLATLHASGIIHRDIKPNNIMLDGAGAHVRLWITDFGLARAPDLTVAGQGMIAGTPAYMAPELFLNQIPSQASDIFAFGLVLHEVFTGERAVRTTGGLSAVPTTGLKSAKVPSYCAHLVAECLSDDPKRRCRAFEEAQNRFSGKDEGPRRELWTRRRFAGAAIAATCAMAGGVWWKRDEIEDLLHPLPIKRFVAILGWPPTADGRAKPMLTGVIDAIESRLARIEAFDHNLLVISPRDIGADPAAPTQLGDVHDAFGANLVLAASVAPRPGHFQLSLRVLNPPATRSIREKQITCPLDRVTSLPERAVRAAAALLDVSRYLQNAQGVSAGTTSADAYEALQAADALRKQPNDIGLDEAIEKYKQAIEIDPRYALAHAKLALAYGRLYFMRRDPGALDLARGNSDIALKLDPRMVEGHLARASVLEQTGDTKAALDVIATALSLDPSNPQTLVWQAQIYTRLNRWADAERVFHRVLKERPNYWLGYNELGYVLNQQGKYHEAIQAFRAASLAAPANALALNNIGAISMQIGDYAEAIENFKKSLALAPSDLAAANLAVVFRSQGKYREAVQFAKRAAELNPGDDGNWLEVGDSYSAWHGHHSEARDAYLRAAKEAERHLQTDPTAGPAWMLLALYRVKVGAPETALPLVAKAEKLGADDVDSQLYKVRILENLGRRDEALETLATCFRRGATTYQVAAFSDLQSLRKDPRYKSIAPSPTAAAG